MVTFTCEVTIHENVDTPVIFNLTWTRVFHNEKADLIVNFSTEMLTSDAKKTVMKKLVLTDLTSQDNGVHCSGVVSSANSFIQGNENMYQNTISVIGESLYVSVSICGVQ